MLLVLPPQVRGETGIRANAGQEPQMSRARSGALGLGGSGSAPSSPRAGGRSPTPEGGRGSLVRGKSGKTRLVRGRGEGGF